MFVLDKKGNERLMEKITVIYTDNSQQEFDLLGFNSMRIRGNFIAIDETQNSVICIFDVKQIIFNKRKEMKD